MPVQVNNKAAVFANNKLNSGKAVKKAGGILPYWVNRQQVEVQGEGKNLKYLHSC